VYDLPQDDLSKSYDMDFQEFIKEDTKTKVFQDENDLENDGHLNNTQVEYQEEKWQFLKNNDDSHFLPFAGDEDTLGKCEI
jgi:hypothetical protein